MAVSRAEKTTELEELTTAFGQSQTAILLDFRGIKVPQVTELRRQVRAAKGTYRVVKNTLAKRALEGTSFESLTAHFEGTTAVAYSESDPVVLAKTLTTFAKTTPALQIKAAVVQGKALVPAEVSELAALPGQARALREAALPAAGADGAAGQRAERRAARFRHGAVGSGKEEERGMTCR